MKNYLTLVVGLFVLTTQILLSQASVRVDAGRSIREWTTVPIGLNLNTLSDGDDNRPEGTRSLAEAIGETGAHFLRFPGGEKSDVYQWAAAPYNDPTTSGLLRKGPSDWPSNDSRFWDLEADTWANDDYNFDEFMADCLATGGEPVISVALDGIYKPKSADGDTSLTREQALEMAVEWVRYANVTHDYGIRYWLLGNETWNGVTYAGAEPNWSLYGRDVAEFATAMKAVDPDILIGINGDATHQLEKALLECADVVDFVDVHTYPAYGITEYAGYVNTLLNPISIIDVAQRAIDRLPDPTVRERLFISMTETSATGFNTSSAWDSGNNLGQALGNFDIMAQLMEDDRLEFAQYWNSRWITPDTGRSHSYDLFTASNELNASGRILSLLQEELKDRMVYTESDNHVRTFATQSFDEDNLTVFLLNKDTIETTTTLTVNGIDEKAEATHSVFTGPDVTDTTTTYTTVPDITLKRGSANLILPPASVTVLRFNNPSSTITSLPVDLIDFRGRFLDGVNRLEWTSSESGAFAGYGLERSTNAFRWDEVAFVPAQNQPETAEYNYEDVSLPESYYRLRMQEVDGSFAYSRVIRIEGLVPTLSVYPNPTGGPVHLPEQYAGAEYRLQSFQGRELLHGLIPADGRVSLGGLPRGIYHLVLENSAQFRVVKR